MKLFSKLIFMFVLVLSSVFAAGFTDTVKMDQNDFNVQFYNCGLDTSCSNPILVKEAHVDTNKYSFNYNTNDYYAEYIFKEGYLPKGFIVHKFNGITSYTFDKKLNGEAPILALSLSNYNPLQGENVSVSVRIGSAFNGISAGTPDYRPSNYMDYFDSDTQVELELVQNNAVLQSFVQKTSVYMQDSNELNFNVNTNNLSGSYTIRVKTNVTDNMFDQNTLVQDQESVNFFVAISDDLEKPVAIAGNDRTVCLNQNVLFDGSNSYDSDGNIVSYSWVFNDGSSSNNEIVNHAFSSVGIYNVILTVIDNDNLIDQDNLVVTVNNCTNMNQNPVANAGSDKTANINTNLVFDGSSSYDSDGSIVSYQWNFGDGNTASGSIVNHAYTQLGTYNVILTVRDDDNAVSTDNLVVNIVNNTIILPLTLDIHADPEDGDLPLEVTFNSTVSGNNPFIYYWNFDDGSHSHQANPVHTFTEKGIYHVTLNVTDYYNNTISDSIRIDVTNETNDENDDYVYGSNGGDKHRLTLGNTLLNQEEYLPGNTIEISSELINNGNYRENGVTFNALIEELGVSSIPVSMTLSKGTTSWEHLNLVLPEDMQPGLYSVKITLGNTYFQDTVYKVVTVTEQDNLKVLLNTDDENNFDYLIVIEIVFISLLILLAILGILLLVREINRIEAI